MMRQKSLDPHPMRLMVVWAGHQERSQMIAVSGTHWGLDCKTQLPDSCYKGNWIQIHRSAAVAFKSSITLTASDLPVSLAPKNSRHFRVATASGWRHLMNTHGTPFVPRRTSSLWKSFRPHVRITTILTQSRIPGQNPRVPYGCYLVHSL